MAQQLGCRAALDRPGRREAAQRVRRKASRKNGLSATVSVRALNVAAFNSLRGFGHHDGTRPHRMRTKSRLPSRSVHPPDR